MANKHYESPQLEVLEFDATAVIATSAGTIWKQSWDNGWGSSWENVSVGGSEV